MINTKDLRNVLHFRVILIDHFTLWQKRGSQRKLWKKESFLHYDFVRCQRHADLSTHKNQMLLYSSTQFALQKIGLEIITDFSISLCSTTTLFTTSFRSCCMAYFKDKGEKLSRRKIDGIFFAIIFSWFTNIAYAILRLTMILSLELHNQIVIDAWH